MEFGGIYMDSHVHCNGTEVGHHPYGYAGFAFDRLVDERNGRQPERGPGLDGVLRG